MADRGKIIKDIKTGGNLAIYIGVPSVVTPIVKERTRDSTPISRICAGFSGMVVSLGISAIAAEWFNTAVDKVADFIGGAKNESKN